MTQDNRLFIIWDPRDGSVPRSNGDINTGGLIGAVGLGNPYIRGYPSYPDDATPDDLRVGDRICGVRYALSGQVGFYDVYRVK